MSDALQGCEGHMQATVWAGPEGAETLTVQVGVTREAVVGKKIRDSVAPLGGVGGQGRVSKETGQTRGGRDGLGSHIEVLGF